MIKVSYSFKFHNVLNLEMIIDCTFDNILSSLEIGVLINILINSLCIIHTAVADDYINYKDSSIQYLWRRGGAHNHYHLQTLYTSILKR